MIECPRIAPGVVSAAEFEALEALRGDGWHCVPIGEDRWAVGHGHTWRLVGSDAAGQLGHPAWLWRASWFHEDADGGEVPTTSSLRELLRQAMPLAGSEHAVIAMISAGLAALRRGQQPAAFVVDAIDQPAASAFALTLIVALPPEWAIRLRVSTGLDEPDPTRWDAIVIDRPPAGFDRIDLNNPPPVDDDPVARFARERLLASDPEAVEAAALVTAGRGPDEWASALERRLGEGTLVQTTLDEDMLLHDPAAAVARLEAELASGRRIDPQLAHDIATVTRRVGDRQLWDAISDRPDDERAAVVRAWLDQAGRQAPRNTVLDAVASVRPIGMALTPWSTALLQWSEHSEAPVKALLALLDGEPLPEEPAGRAALFTELAILLCHRGRWDELVHLLQHGCADRLAREGASRALALAWLQLPVTERAGMPLTEIVAALVSAADGDQAALALYLGLLREGRPQSAAVVVEQWARHFDDRAAAVEHTGADALVARIRGGPHASSWARAAWTHAPAERARHIIFCAVTGPDDPVWVGVEAWASSIDGPDAYKRLIRMGHLLPEANHALEPVARGLIPGVVRSSPFPDERLHAVARQFAAAPNAGPEWAFIAATTAAPGAVPVAELTRATVALCAAPPRDQTIRATTLSCADGIGAAYSWSAAAHGAWFTRFLTAPDGDAAGMPVQLAEALASSIVRREDGIAYLAEVTPHLLGLDSDHPALGPFLALVLPRTLATRQDVVAYRQAVDTSTAPIRNAKAWETQTAALLTR
jgi:hypothetical protein